MTPEAAVDLEGVGVVATAVLDRIYAWPAGAGSTPEPVRSFGGAFYALGALAALAPHPSCVVPVLRIGADAAPFLRAELARLGVDLGYLVPTAAPQNAVELRYIGPEHRHEVLRGGVPPLRLGDVAAALPEVRALYVNFVAGNELSLRTFRAIRRAFAGPVYVDLHSLLLAPTRGGLRTYRTLPDWREWVGCADLVQCNLQEAAMLLRSDGEEPRRGSRAARGGQEPQAPPSAADLERLARAVLELGPRLFVVTGGSRAVRAWSAGGGSWRFEPRPPGRVRDPTGCGDVLGGAFCALRFLRGLPERAALGAAVEAAARASTRVGTEGLAEDLRAWDADRDG